MLARDTSLMETVVTSPSLRSVPLRPVIIDQNLLSQVAYRLNAPGLISNVGWFAGFIGCFKPVWMMIGKNKPQEIEKDDWEIPFEAIQELQWLGSGAQGAVFMGKYDGEQVAVKKVREEFETDIKHLRKLNHPNIVLFK